MREYKFRGRSIEPLVGDDQWLYGFGVHVVELTDGGKEYWLYTENGPYQVDPETVGQYTGLPDRNGKEIYEGDILKYTSRERVGERRVTRKRGYDTYDVYDDVEITGVVRFGTINKPFVEGIPIYYVDTDKTISYDTYFWGSGKKSDRPERATSGLTKPLSTKIMYEVIGSVYDNPDLLEGEKI